MLADTREDGGGRGGADGGTRPRALGASQAQELAGCAKQTEARTHVALPSRPKAVRRLVELGLRGKAKGVLPVQSKPRANCASTWIT
jgi:hypothetical protein